MRAATDRLVLRLAAGPDDRAGAERLRYVVFVAELGGDGPLVDHVGRYERDAFDAHVDHLILVDPRIDPASHDHVAGAYRLLRSAVADRLGRFYSESEYDLAPLRATGRPLLELGRSCLRAEYRGGKAMFRLWQGLADYAFAHRAEILFGVASFHGTDPAPLAPALSLLHHRHLAPASLRVRARPAGYQRMDLLPEAAIDRVAAMRGVPSLIKAYLRLGGVVGEGAFVDRAFNTTDVCLVMDTVAMAAGDRARYAEGRR